MGYSSGKGSNDTTIEKIGQLFYAINWNTHKYEHIEEVPDYVVDVLPFFAAAIIIEVVITYLKGYEHARFFYMINNMSAGIIQQIFKAAQPPLLLIAYCWMHKNYRIYQLPWDSPVTWYLAFLAVDFLYYWFHRATHEINIFWASHQMHHSSEDMNLTTAMRQSVVQKYISTLFFLPMALCVPPSIFYIHRQFNLLYQFWIHTEIIRNLGPLEYVLNTASHHRVHHGRNPYCIDKNYGGTLIIWDRIFNTFAAEDEKVAYGLVHMQTTSNPWVLQLGHFFSIFKRAGRMENWKDTLSVLFRGPGWLSKSEMVGLTPEEMELPEVENPQVYRDIQYFDMENNKMESIYAFVHFIALDVVFNLFFTQRTTLSSVEVTAFILFIFWTLTSIGFVLENRPFWRWIESFRCFVVLLVDFLLIWHGQSIPLLNIYILNALRCLYLASIGFALLMVSEKSSKTKKQQ